VLVRAARLPGSPLWVRFGRSGGSFSSFGRVVQLVQLVQLRSGGSCGRPREIVWSGRLRASVSTRLGVSFGRTRPYQKMLSCDPRLDLCTFVQLFCPALPCGFVSVVRARTENRSVASFEGVRVKSFRRVVWAQLVRAGRSGERARIKKC